MLVSSFATLEEEFIARVHRMVWCTLATVDAHGRPRTRILHTIWEGPIGWIATRRHSPKADDLLYSPHVSLAYTSDLVHPVYAECLARWEDDPAEKARIWALFKEAAPPLGYDPATIFADVDDPSYGLLRLDPERIALEDVSGQGERRIVWRAAR